MQRFEMSKDNEIVLNCKILIVYIYLSKDPWRNDDENPHRFRGNSFGGLAQW